MALSLPEGHQHNKTSTNQRQNTRYQCAPATIGQLVASNRKEFLKGWVLDLSKTGAGLLMMRPIQRQKAVLRIIGPTDRKKHEIAAEVVHCTQKLQNNEWVVGLRFEQPLSDDQLESLL